MVPCVGPQVRSETQTVFGRQRNGACLLHERGRTRACLERDLARLHQTRDLRVIHVLRYCTILDALYGFIYHEGWHEKPFARRDRNPKTIFDFNIEPRRIKTGG